MNSQPVCARACGSGTDRGSDRPGDEECRSTAVYPAVQVCIDWTWPAGAALASGARRGAARLMVPLIRSVF